MHSFIDMQLVSQTVYNSIPTGIIVRYKCLKLSILNVLQKRKIHPYTTLYFQ